MCAPFALVAGAARKGFVLFVSPMARGGAIRAEMFNGFVITPIAVGDAAVAVGPVIGLGGSNSGEEEKATENRGRSHRFTRKRAEQVESHSSLPERGPDRFRAAPCRIKHLFGRNVARQKTSVKRKRAPEGKGAPVAGATVAGKL